MDDKEVYTAEEVAEIVQCCGEISKKSKYIEVWKAEPSSSGLVIELLQKEEAYYRHNIPENVRKAIGLEKKADELF